MRSSPTPPAEPTPWAVGRFCRSGWNRDDLAYPSACQTVMRYALPIAYDLTSRGDQRFSTPGDGTSDPRARSGHAGACSFTTALLQFMGDWGAIRRRIP